MLDEIRWVAVAVTTAASAPGRRGIARTKNTFDLAFSPPEDTDGDGLFDADGGDGRTVTLQTDPTQDTYDSPVGCTNSVAGSRGSRPEMRSLLSGER
jgi:hypothetical protein